MLSFLYACAKIALWFLGLSWLDARLSPTQMPDDHEKRIRSADIVSRMIALVFAVWTSLHGLGYVFGIIGERQLLWCRESAVAFLIYDAVEKIRTRRVAKSTAGSLDTSPFMVLFHHVVTVMFMYGYLFNGQVGGAIAYFIGELPVAMINISWIMYYMNEENSRIFAATSHITVGSYFACRVVLFPLIFIVSVFPNIQFMNPLSWICCILLLFVYALNLVWFFAILKRHREQVKDSSMTSCSQPMRWTDLIRIMKNVRL